jgi:hypothetical protein
LSYRNDHDAALSRIDALEAELERARSDDGATAARAELARLEGEVRRAREARDKLLDELEDAAPRRRIIPRWIGVLVAMVVMVSWFAFRTIGRAEHVAPQPEQPAYVPPPAPPPTVPRSATRLVECARELERAIAEHSASSQTCIDQIRVGTNDAILGDDVRALLQRWLDAEQGIITANASSVAVAWRDQLAPEIRKVIIPSFTR